MNIKSCSIKIKKNYLLLAVFILILFFNNCSNDLLKNNIIYQDQKIKFPMWTIYESGAKLYKSPQKGITLDKIPYNKTVEINGFQIIGDINNNTRWFHVIWKNKRGWVDADELSIIQPENIKILLSNYNWYYFNEDFTYNSKIEGIIESYISSRKMEYNKITKLLIFKGDKKTRNVEYKISKITPLMIIINDLKSGENYYLYRDNNPIFDAIYYSKKIEVKNYIKDIHILNSRNYDGNTPIIYSLKRNYDIAKLILEHEPDINTKNSYGENVLSYSLEYPDVMLHLLKRGIETNNISAKNNENILHMYFRNKADWDLIADFTRIFIANGIDVNLKDIYGNTPLYTYCYFYDNDFPMDKYLETFKILLDAGADINVQNNEGYTCLHYLSNKNNYDLIKFMIENGADPNIKDKNNNVPLFNTLNYNRKSAEALLEYGADPTAVNKEGKSAVSLIENKIKEDYGYDNIAKILIQKGHDINVKFENNETLLHYAAKNGNLELTKLLLEKKYDVNSTYNDGKTPLHLLSYNDNGYKLVKILLDNGAQINQQDEYYKRTPLHFAVDDNDINLVKELIKYGPDKNIEDKDGRTPAELAQYRGYGRLYPLLNDK